MMSNDPKDNLQAPGQPQASPVPVWVFAAMLLALFLCGWYFDRHSGWFDAQVYAPFRSSDELEAYQPKSGAAAFFAEGQRQYSLTCATCHGDNGQGKPGQAPPLAGSEWVITDSSKRVEQIPQLGLNGIIHVKGEEWNLQMAGMGVGLSDSDLAAVLTYIRGSWGNTAAPVSDDDVKAMRALVAGHPPINGEAGLKAIKE
jgi:mono/diheme cytochrome c family protein